MLSMHNARARVTITVTTHPDNRRFVVRSAQPAASPALAMEQRTFIDQPSAEHFAAGVAAGLRACGQPCEIVIDLPSEDDADLLDFGSFDEQAWAAAERRAVGPEVDAVSARLARDAEAGHYRAKALGL